MKQPSGIITLFQRLCYTLSPAEDRQHLLGDFNEIFCELAQEEGAFKAGIWYITQCLTTLPELLYYQWRWRFSMIKNYFKIAFRQFQRHFGYSLINLIGLSVGLAACLLIFVWIQYQYSYNTYHENIDNIQWLRCYQQYGERRARGWGIPPMVAPTLKDEYPEVLESARFMNGQGNALFTIGDKQIKTPFQMADPSIFNVFTFPWVQGDMQNLNDDPFIMVLSQSMAQRFFGSKNPIGETVRMNNAHDFRVVGVMRDIPANSTRHFDIWTPLTFVERTTRPDFLQTWYNCSFRAYLLMQPGADIEAFNKNIFERIRQSDPDTNLDAFVSPYGDEYIKDYGVDKRIRMLSIICGLILLVACINYMNLATARSVRRAREVGMRKVSGAHRGQIIRQFYGESIFLSLLATLLGLLLALALLGPFNRLAGETIPYALFFTSRILLALAGLIIITGFLAGSYPALLLSRFKPVQVLKNSVDKGRSGAAFRRVLVIFQFGISTILIAGTLVTLGQTRYLQTKDLGFSKEQLLYVPLQGSVQENRAPYKQALLEHPSVLHATATSHSPSGVYWNGQGWNWEGKDPNVNPLVTYIFVDQDFAKTFEIEMSAGEFYNDVTIQSKTIGIINETFAEMLKTEDPVGARVWRGSNNYSVLGVVKDFHYTPAVRRIGPMIVAPPSKNRDMRYLFLKVDGKSMQEALSHIKSVTERFNPNFPFEYHFLDEDYANMYSSIERMGAIYRIFAILAILISALGLAGLASFMAERRIKEIGIRRVLGAGVSGIIGMMLKGQLSWVLLSNLIAWPLAYLYLKNWLSQYPYRIELTPLPFFMASAVALSMALGSVLFQSTRAAISNPAQSLRHE